MDGPRIIVNAKVYQQVTGQAGVKGLAAVCEEAAEEYGIRIGVAPPMVELATVGRLGLANVVVWAQHCDALVPGGGTGWTTPESVKATGAKGALLNHAEHKIPHGDVGATVERLRALGLQSIVCADSLGEAQALAPLEPTYLAIEPPQLIGGDVSVTTADPSIVEDAVRVVRKASPDTFVLCGAGVKTGEDVAKAIELGAYGVLLASGVVKHAKPLAALRDLCSGLP